MGGLERKGLIASGSPAAIQQHVQEVAGAGPGPLHPGGGLHGAV